MRDTAKRSRYSTYLYYKESNLTQRMRRCWLRFSFYALTNRLQTSTLGSWVHNLTIMRTLIQQWLMFGAKNAQDDLKLYEIVVKSFNEKLDVQDFKDASETVNGNYDVDKLYNRYEDLWFFLSYLKRNDITF